MKRFLTILLVCIMSFAAMAKQNWQAQSVLKSGTWVKIRVAEAGIHQLTYNQIKEAGILHPEKVRIYGYGGIQLTQDILAPITDDLPEIPFYMDKGSNGVFDSGDRILFYAVANIGWTFDGDYLRHTRNTYSDYGYYFLTEAGEEEESHTEALKSSDNSKGKYNNEAIICTDVVTSLTPMLHENDLVNLIDPNGQEGGGRHFYGEVFNNRTPQRTFSFNVSNATGEDATVRCHVAANSPSRSVFTIANGAKQHKLTTSEISDLYTKGTDATMLTTWPISPMSEEQTLTINFSSDAATANGYLDYIEWVVPTRLVMGDKELEIRSAENYGESTLNHYHLAKASAETQVWNITDLGNIYACETTLSHDTLSWIGSNEEGVQTYIAFQPSAKFATPEIEGEIKNQNLHALNNIDYVIITPAQFLSASERLAKAHYDMDGMTTAVVTDQQVFNEFSSGTPDATAFRRLMKMLYDRANEDGSILPPSHLLLMGDGSFDNRKLLTTSPANTMLTYQAENSLIETQAYATDDYFGFLEDQKNGEDRTRKMSIGVGRLPVNTVEEAEVVVDKTIRYMKNDLEGNWKQQLIFMADDGDKGGHVQTAEASAELVRRDNPSMIVHKLYLDAYHQETNSSGQSYPTLRNTFLKMMDEGVLLFDYSGHGGYNGVTNESMLNINIINQMTNNRLAFWALATCNFAHFDAFHTSAAELAITNPIGGAIGVFSADRTVYLEENKILNRNVCQQLFRHDNPCSYTATLGSAVYQGKNATTGYSINKLSYVLLGDPAIRLHYPTDYDITVRFVRPDGIDPENYTDTLHALSTATLEGAIVDLMGDTLEWFNGPVTIQIYDKMQVRKTNDNDVTIESEKTRISFNDYPDKLFSGETTVTDGRFSIQFMVPKDIHYNYGAGRIVMYAHDTEENMDAVGHYEDFIIGGSSPVVIQDTVGPDMKIYLNDNLWTSGGKVNPYPHFFAELYDENGINTMGTGIGHDLMLVVDNDVNTTYILNNYYRSLNGNFRQGKVSFQMDEQTEGYHHLLFRAWDMIGNSTSQELIYRVVKGLDTQIISVQAYPNPVSVANSITISIHHDRPNDRLTAVLCVYNLQGQLVWENSRPCENTMEWNIGEMGIPNGAYLYRIALQSATDGTTVSTTGKFIVTK